MSAPVLALIRRSAARVIDEAFAELWEEKDLTNLTREAEQAIAECEDYPANAESLYLDAWKAAIPTAKQDAPFDWHSWGIRLREQCDGSLEALLAVRKWVQLLEKNGQTVANAAQLDHAVAEMERVRKRLEEHLLWPPTPEEIAETDAEIASGEGYSLEEAFAHAAGVSVDEWLRRVEQHKRERSDDADGQGNP